MSIVSLSHTISADELSALKDWFVANRRPLPWRETRDPYRVWVSEIMLQQTQVVKVISYYERFMQRFPTVQDLAKAHIDDVMALWSGLGYYSRCRLMHHCSQFVVERCDGAFPSTAAELLHLPGIGPYTARAISSICFRESAGVIDGNVKRVMARRHGRPSGFVNGGEKQALQIWLDQVATTFVGHPGDLNEAWMELGATICTPKKVQCGDCPISDGCEAYKQGVVDSIPKPRLRKAPKQVELHVVMARRMGHIYLVKQVAAQLFKGLYTLPMVDLERISRSGERRGHFRHVLTHRKLDIHVWNVPAREVESLAPDGVWMMLDRLSDIGHPRWVDIACARFLDDKPL